ncbi:MAG: hypothetical protein DCC75_03190 [Proteobacteria bacterium]|nr:MAG: hypothetical protein DCC75_03190 [Pseudomonadota bacterium]
MAGSSPISLTAALIKMASMLLTVLCPAAVLLAEHPIDVERSAAQAEYFRAMATFDKLPARKASKSSRLAAAKSAWALGLTERASKEFDQLLREPGLTLKEQGQALVARAIIEFQEDRYQVASLFAERAVKAIEAGAIRAQAYGVWGAALSRMNSWGAAEEKLRTALEEAALSDKARYHFELGNCQLRLNKLAQARSNFESIPIDDDYAPAAVRGLAQIALQSSNYSDLRFWLERGRSDFPQHFIDSWVYYALAQAAIAEKDGTKLIELSQEAANRYPPSDPWITLMQGGIEAHFWENPPGRIPKVEEGRKP